jgi:uncharacterized protein (DUF2147 family)
MRNVSTLFLAIAISAVGGGAYADEPSAAGFWVTPDHGAVINIAPCGDAGLCGRLVGLRDDHGPGDVPRDTHNPEKERRNTPMCGLVMMGGLKPAKGSPPKWDSGWVYDPESGSTYKAEMRLEGPDRLKLRGYLGISLFGRTQDWTRETGEAKNRCTPPVGG